MDQAPGSPQGPEDQGPQQAEGLPGCYRHPDRETGIRCTRCERPICPECMVSASVGFQCPDCVRGGSGTGHRPDAAMPRTIAGGTIASDPRLVTKILLGINLAVFIAVRASNSLLGDLVLIGTWPPAPFTATEGVADGQWYRLVTSMFTHQEIWHIAFNMLSLWWLGGPLEAALGRARYLALYLVSGLVGSVLAYLLESPTTATLGASGAIFGLFGATAVLMRRLNYDMRPIIALLVINLIFTFNPAFDISWQAHIGGLAGGVVIGYAMVHAPRERRALVQYGTCALVLALVVVLTLVRTAQLT
ncbi:MULTISPECIES: rhomboid family intramembrane serine protease [unclassified Streptomyces]|uniref:rhomboid family intramembrane serine protease n=1 Tax=unclassified Streptomyces TaxID=2593676 RepID=UPI002253D9F2|nr:MULTISPECIES: rhomboid family intramembrane serine protease [unclassified Streptomyces]MCX5332847.1 rhomboid family intramembrane serine protease [Streptomyces sp. NBC_00140]MCX5362245.1 rhomboid family intramembrane serine protease [Streptomyces sp. NBC_00124]